MRADLEAKIRLLPTNPGVYVMLGADGEIIYVGKAKNLKNRVTQYFYDSVKTEKVMAMVGEHMKNVELSGIWSVDILEDECHDFWLIDMALGHRSAYWNPKKAGVDNG